MDARTEHMQIEIATLKKALERMRREMVELTTRLQVVTDQTQGGKR